MGDPTRHTFALLKPLCVGVMQLASALGRGDAAASAPPSASPLSGLCSALLHTTPHLSAAHLAREGLPRCIDYILLPLLMLLPGGLPLAAGEAPLRAPDRVVEQALRAICALLLVVDPGAFCCEATPGAPGAPEGAAGSSPGVASRVGDLLYRCIVILASRGPPEGGKGSSSGGAAAPAPGAAAQQHSPETLGAACDIVALLCGFAGGGQSWVQEHCTAQVTASVLQLLGAQQEQQQQPSLLPASATGSAPPFLQCTVPPLHSGDMASILLASLLPLC
jgi:hypothetical protein